MIATRRGRLLRFGVIVAVIVGVIALVLSRIDFGETIKEVTLPLRHDDIIRQQAERHDIDPALIAAIIFEESRFVDQTSGAGARGLMQITPDTAETIETLSGGETFVFEDLADPDLNIRYGTFYLNHLLDRFGGNEVAALAAYNAGPRTLRLGEARLSRSTTSSSPRRVLTSSPFSSGASSTGRTTRRSSGSTDA